MSGFDASFEDRFEGQEPMKVRLATITKDRYMNFILESVDPEDFPFLNKTISAEGAKKIRDALIEAYPLAEDLFEGEPEWPELPAEVEADQAVQFNIGGDLVINF